MFDEFICRDYVLTLVKLREKVIYKSVYFMSKVIMHFNCTKVKKSRELVRFEINKETHALLS